MGHGAPPIRRPSVALIRLQISGVSMMRNRDWNGDGFTAALESALHRREFRTARSTGQAPIFRAA
jgi:hypothetical protein